MLDIYFLRKNKEKVLLGLKKRKFKKLYLIDEILMLYDEKKKMKISLNKILENENILSKKISNIIKNNRDLSEIEYLKKNSIILKKKKKNIRNKLKKIFISINKKLIYIPNIPNDNVKDNYEENNIIFKNEKIISNIKNPLPHWELSKKFNLFDLSLGSKICKSGFAVYIDKCAKLHRSLIQYFLDENINNSYKEYSLPYLINNISGYSTGQIPDKNNQMYFIEKDNFYLIPTGEIPLMNCYRNKIFKDTDLPIKSTTYTSCFRREAGSYGSKVRGLNRLHQFEKVEIIQINIPENSTNSLYDMITHIKKILKSLELPFRIIKLTAKNLSYSSSITYDFEVYSIAQKKWLEVSSVSNCNDFQSRRLNIKYKKRITGEVGYCHTLNGSSLALPRILVTILENNQTNNKITIPKVLIPYTGFCHIKNDL
ncbi:serine--tRNA ligase [Blattabacterium cuenoti]|uniref:serine--tRNA ligase n=1 Tax=Blattabacterium cuenoti TaxID=1653831 RepID=UPI00163BCC13|nr:serine--tRNA ligase [Blattabacterium cuenoti]